MQRSITTIQKSKIEANWTFWMVSAEKWREKLDLFEKTKPITCLRPEILSTNLEIRKR
jgi:hypothetical protein